MRKNSLRLSPVRAAIATLVLAALPMSSFAFVSVGISVNFAPPALPVYVQPPCPAVGYIWTPGYWAWGDDDYYWVPGTWVLAPEPGFLWTPGYWGWGGGVYLWHAGYWGPHVGFYGGINYGFGYTGVGFEGGYWRGHDFYYNRAVSNVNVTNVTNVYNKTVINNVTVNHVSFNGGEGGVRAQPTAAQLSAEHEHHVDFTPVQREHEHLASANHDLRASVNGGKPSIAATARPAVFTGHGIESARAAGAPYHGGTQPGVGQHGTTGRGPELHAAGPGSAGSAGAAHGGIGGNPASAHGGIGGNASAAHGGVGGSAGAAHGAVVHNDRPPGATGNAITGTARGASGAGVHGGAVGGGLGAGNANRSAEFHAGGPSHESQQRLASARNDRPPSGSASHSGGSNFGAGAPNTAMSHNEAARAPQPHVNQMSSPRSFEHSAPPNGRAGGQGPAMPHQYSQPAPHPQAMPHQYSQPAPHPQAMPHVQSAPRPQPAPQHMEMQRSGGEPRGQMGPQPQGRGGPHDQNRGRR